MKKIFLLFLMYGISISLTIAQKIVHTHYITYYNSAKKGPDSVIWNLTPSMVSCDVMSRHDGYATDPMLPGSVKKSDYTNSGYSKGHLFNWDEAKCDGGTIAECFYMTNMLPQNQSFNSGDWGTVERYERNLAQTQTIHIIAGGSGSKGTTTGGVNIPEFFWKAIFANGKWTCWMMPNKNTSVGHDYNFWIIKLADFDNKTNLDLK